MVVFAGSSRIIGLWRARMAPLILIILGVSGVYADSHTLRYYETAVSAPGSGLPMFSVVGYVDDQEIENYNSDTRQYLPKTEWMKKLEPEYWERNTKGNQANEPIMKYNVQTAMKRFNQTGGIHTFQEMYRCTLRDDGSTEGYYQYGYDGREFMYLDTQSWDYMATMPEAQITAQRWNSPEQRVGERNKNYLQNICVEELKQIIQHGREDLERRVRPEVKVWSRQSPDGVTRLHCLAYGFHPRAVYVKWVRNGVDDVPADEAGPLLPHPDGTYQIRVSAEVLPKEGDTYSCHVDHSSLEKNFNVPWDPNAEFKDKMPIVIAVVAIVLLLLVAAAGIGFIVYRRQRGNCPAAAPRANYVPAPNKEEQSSTSSDSAQA